MWEQTKTKKKIFKKKDPLWFRLLSQVKHTNHTWHWFVWKPKPNTPSKFKLIINFNGIWSRFIQ